MSSIEDRLEKWVRRNALADFDGLACTHFTLFHLGGNGKMGSAVTTIKARGDDTGIEETVSEILETASGDATGVGTVQTYVVFAYYGEDKKGRARFTLKASPNEDTDSEPNEGAQLTEPATPTGLLTQLMRHNEMTMRTSSASLGNLLATMQAMMAQQGRAIEKMMGDRMESVEIFESLMSLKHEREMDVVRETEKTERRKVFVDKLSPLVAVAVNKMAGQKLLPSKNPQNMALEELFKTLRPEQLEKLGTILTPDQLMLILSVAGPYVGGAEPVEQLPAGKKNGH